MFIVSAIVIMILLANSVIVPTGVVVAVYVLAALEALFYVAVIAFQIYAAWKLK